MTIDNSKSWNVELENYISFKWFQNAWFINALLVFGCVMPFATILSIICFNSRNKQIKRGGGPLIEAVVTSDDSNGDAYEKMQISLHQNIEKLEQLLKDRRPEVDAEANHVYESMLESLTNLKPAVIALEEEKKQLEQEIVMIKDNLVTLKDEELYQSFSLYESMYNFCNAEEYKIQLDAIREKQKYLIKNNKAVSGCEYWTVNNSKVQGNRMVNDTKKLLLRAFNSECDFTISKVTYRNIESSIKRITRASESISKLGRTMSIAILPEYQNLKLQELHLAFEYAEEKQKEKERLRELRAEQRELAKLKKEIEEERKKVQKEKLHYDMAIKNVKKQIALCTDSEQMFELNNKLEELESRSVEIDKNLVDLDYREAKEKAGYVYIISNIGAFGPDIYKIGMTRRLDPMECVNELGDASVPFKFDTHALIFSDNVPALEAALHNAFATHKVNMINQRREFSM